MRESRRAAPRRATASRQRCRRSAARPQPRHRRPPRPAALLTPAQRAGLRRPRLLELLAKYEELKGTGKLDQYLAKRRKRNAAKDHRYLPGERRGGRGDDGSGDSK